MLQSSPSHAPDRIATDGALWKSYAAALGLATAVGVAYFLAARLSLALLITPDGVAAFWPAAGLATGAIIALGPSARLPTALGAAAASIVANIIGERTLPAALVFAACAAGEPLLIGWLIERYHGSDFSLDSLPRVLGFFLATSVAAIISGLVGTVGFVLFQDIESTFANTALHWLVSHTLGVLAVAPLVIGMVRSAHRPPRLAEVLEGACILAVLTLTCALTFGRPTDDWFTIVPFAMLLPMLIWPAARCPPVFAAAAVFIVALVVVWTLTFGLGRLGDASVPLADRLLAAQVALLATSTCALVVAALFAERRSHEIVLNTTNARLHSQKEAFRRLLGSLPAAIYTTDKQGRITYCNQAAVDLWGTRPKPGTNKWFDLWRLHYPDGTSMPLNDRPTHIVLKQGRAVRGREALLERPDGTLVPIMPCPAPLIDEHGRVIGVVNMQIDLTERKRAEAALAERDTLLTLASKVARVGSYTLEFNTSVVQMSPGCAALYGLPEGTTELSRAGCRARVLPEDLPALDAQFAKACAEMQREHVAQFRIVRLNDQEVRWIETRSLISYDSGRTVRVVGIGIDVTDRKRAEEHQRLLIAELDHRVKNVLATVSAVASRTQDETCSGADFAATLAGRIQSMAATHELLSGRQWHGVSVRELVRRELAPYATANNTDVGGPELTLIPEAAQSVSMVLHELTTNAAKYGALSTDDGRISVLWSRTPDCIRIEWQESGGPPVRAPQRSGYGTDVILGIVPYELDGNVDLTFEPPGVRCVLAIPLAALNGARRADNDLAGLIEANRRLAGLPQGTRPQPN